MKTIILSNKSKEERAESKEITPSGNNNLLKHFSLLFTLLSLLLVTSCDSYLDTTNEQADPAHEELTSLSALRAATAGLYCQPWYYFHKQRFLQLGDARANNLLNNGSSSNDYNAQVSFNEETSNTTIANAWGSLYNVITQSAYVIDDYAPFCVNNGSCTQDEANVCIAEAKFMRALAYWFLAIYWHDVPIVDNATTVSTVARANRFEDVMLYAINDAEWAKQWLSVTPYAKGRVSKVSAEALLSRLYLTVADYAQGGHFSSDFKSSVIDKYYADDFDYSSSTLSDFFFQKAADNANEAIADAPKGGYGLMSNYEDIFKVVNNNCQESLFAIQFVPGSTAYGLGNELQGNLCYDRCVDNNYGMAYNTFASYDFCLVAAHRGGLQRTRGNVFLDGMTYDYLYHERDTCRNHFGKHQGDVWTVVRPRTTVPIKKQVVGGPIATNNTAIQGNSGFDTPFIRMSEVYLNLTEALMGLNHVSETSDSKILEGVNTVRRRAYAYEISNGTYPGDYTTFNLDSMLLERRMEFFCEGLSWADVVRRSFMGSEDLQHILDYNNNKLFEQTGDELMGCNREYGYRYTADSDVNKVGTVTLTTNTDGSYRIARAAKESVHNIPDGSYVHSSEVGEGDNLWSMIYPPTESSADTNLLLAPVAYDFTEILSSKN